MPRPHKLPELPIASSLSSQNDWYTVEGILKERAGDYLVKWEGTDQDTGRPFEPSWVPKSDVTLALERDWQSWKATHPRLRERDPEAHPFDDSQPRSSLADASNSASSGDDCSIDDKVSARSAVRSRSRARRVIDSSSSSQAPASQPQREQQTDQSGRLILQLPPLPDSASQYEYYSQGSLHNSALDHFPSSQRRYVDDLNTQIDYVPPSSRIVPDSQAQDLTVWESNHELLHGIGNLQAEEPVPQRTRQSLRKQLGPSEALSHDGTSSSSRSWGQTAAGSPHSDAQLGRAGRNKLGLNIETSPEELRRSPRSQKSSPNPSQPSLAKVIHSPATTKPAHASPLRSSFTINIDRQTSEGRSEGSENARDLLNPARSTQRLTRAMSSRPSTPPHQDLLEPIQHTGNYPSLSSPSMAIRDRVKPQDDTLRTATSLQTSPLPNITETKPTPPRQDLASVTTPQPNFQRFESPSSSPMRPRSLSPSQVAEQATTKVSDLKGKFIMTPVHLLPDTLKSYQNILSWNKDSIEALLYTSGPVPETVLQELKITLKELCDVCFHPDMIIKSETPTQQPVEAFAKFTTSVSGKFAVVGGLVSSLSHSNRVVHVGIVVEGKQEGILMTEYLRGIGIKPFSLSIRPTTEDATGPLATVLDLGDDTADLINELTTFDVIVGTSRNFHASSRLAGEIRQLASRASKECTIANLVVPYTMEHVLGSAASTDNLTSSYLKAAFILAGQVYQQLKHASRNQTPPGSIGEQIALLTLTTLPEQTVDVPTLAKFPLPAFPELKMETSAGAARESTPSGLKRRAEDELVTANVKKAKSTTPAPASSSLHDTTHVSDTTAATSSAAEAARAAEAHDQSHMGIEGLHKIIRTIELSNTQLLQQNQELQKGILDVDRTDAANTKLKEIATILREKLQQAEADLKAARALNAGSLHPDIRELEALRTKVQEVESLEKKLQSANKDREFITARYQEAGNAANEYRESFEELQREAIKLRQQASGEARLCRESYLTKLDRTLKQDTKKSQMEAQVLRRMLDQTNAENESLKEECSRLKERIGTGMSTRASVRANSPAPGSRLGTPVAGATMSRSNSRQGTPQPSNGPAAARMKINVGPSGSHRSQLRETRGS